MPVPFFFACRSSSILSKLSLSYWTSSLDACWCDTYWMCNLFKWSVHYRGGIIESTISACFIIDYLRFLEILSRLDHPCISIDGRLSLNHRFRSKARTLSKIKEHWGASLWNLFKSLLVISKYQIKLSCLKIYYNEI